MFDKLGPEIPEIPEAISIQSRQTYKVEDLELKHLGYYKAGEIIFNYYTDKEKHIWFEELFEEPDGRIVDEYEHLFGKKERRKKHVI